MHFWALLCLKFELNICMSDPYGWFIMGQQLSNIVKPNVSLCCKEGGWPGKAV